jgi:hypothetical protein
MKAPSPDPHLARTPGQLEKFPESFIDEMDDILIQPEWFNAWEGYFKEELPVGDEYERLVQTTMALGGEVREFRMQRNRAMLASWGELKITSERDKRTMTWADLGLMYNIEPFQKESVQRYVTLPGSPADQYLNEANLGFDTLLEHLDVWKAVSPTPFPSFYHDRNFKGADVLHCCYGDIQRMGVKAGPDGVVWLRQEKPTTITFMADEREAPMEDEGERPPKMKPIRSLAEEEMDEESNEDPLMTNRKRKGVNQPESRLEPFL